METAITPDLTRDFLSSARIFAKAVRDVFEGAILREVVGEKLSFSQLKLLYLVAQTDSVTIREVGEFLGISSPAASRAVEKLVRRRLLRRSDIQGDRRISQLALTEASRRLLDTYEAARNHKAASIFAQFSPAELRHTHELLDRLAAAIVGQTPEQDACMQCEIYFRKRCGFGELGGRACFYEQHQSELRDGGEDAARVPDSVEPHAPASASNGE